MFESEEEAGLKKKEEFKPKREVSRPDLIELANAHVTQIGNGPWEVRANITNDLLFTLNGKYTEGQIFEILAFSREYEQKALQSGIAFGKKLAKALYDKRMGDLLQANDIATRENLRLAEILETKIGEKE
jgi:hypothetical protein